MRYNDIPMKIAKKQNKIKLMQGAGNDAELLKKMCCWWECKMVNGTATLKTSK